MKPMKCFQRCALLVFVAAVAMAGFTRYSGIARGRHLAQPEAPVARTVINPLFGTFQKNIEGVWLGAIEAGGTKLRLALKISRSPAGVLVAKLDSLDQGANDLPIDTITLDGDIVRFAATNLGLSFEGKLSADGSEIVGTLNQGPGTFPLTFKRADKLPTPGRPQDPQKPYPYAEEEVTYENKADNVKLAGTLTLPKSPNPVPAVVLITGSGSEDRNETVYGHRPFLVLADHLTRQGIAVLRVDDRGIGGSSVGSPMTDTSENYAGDVLAGVAYLKTRKEIDPRKIGLIGHSEGGMIAPHAATKSKDVAFIVMMAGLGQTGIDLVLSQNDLVLKAGGADPATIKEAGTMFTNIFAILKKEPDKAAAEKQMREMVAARVAAMTEAQKNAFAPVLASLNKQMSSYSTGWFRYFLFFDPAPMLRKVRIPVLALFGEKDLQVPATENLPLIREALKAGGNKDYTALTLPGLNHLFQTSTTGSPSEYSQIEETISPAALKIISDWILKHTSSPAGSKQ